MILKNERVKVTKNLSREQLPAGYWTKKTIKEAIKDFKNFKEWYERKNKWSLGDNKFQEYVLTPN